MWTGAGLAHTPPVSRRLVSTGRRLAGSGQPPTRLDQPPPRRVRSATGLSGPLGLSGAAEDVVERSPLGAFLHGPRNPPPLDQLPYDTHEFSRLERLGEEGVDADIEAVVDLVLSTGADDGEGKITGPWIGTQPCGGPQAVQSRHHDIEGDRIGPHLMNDIQTLGTISRGHHLETLKFEIDPDQLPDDLVVVHNKHPAKGAWHNSRVGRDRPPRPGFSHFHPVRATPAPVTPGNPFLITSGELVVFYPSPRASSSAADTPP